MVLTFLGSNVSTALGDSCRFRYYRVKQIHKKRVRRRGKPLVSKPFVEGSDARNEQFRCQLKRETPLRSTSNDVCQSCDRCNVDFQFLVCVPPDDVLEDDAALLVPDNQPSDCVPPRVAVKDDATELVPDDQPAKRRRLTEAFRKAYGVDFYITWAR